MKQLRSVILMVDGRRNPNCDSRSWTNGRPRSAYSLQAPANTLARLKKCLWVGPQIDTGIAAGNALEQADWELPVQPLPMTRKASCLVVLPTLLLVLELGSLHAEHPEIEGGVSFNTNILGQTVQGDFSYRPDMPIQIDTDVLTIAALFNNCVFAAGGIVEGAYQAQSTLSERGQYNTGTTICDYYRTWNSNCVGFWWRGHDWLPGNSTIKGYFEIMM